MTKMQNPAPDGVHKMHLLVLRSSLRSTSEPSQHRGPPTGVREEFERRGSLRWKTDIETVHIIPGREPCSWEWSAPLNRTPEVLSKTTLFTPGDAPPKPATVAPSTSTLAGERRSRLLALPPRGQATPRDSGHVELPKWQQDVASFAGAKQLFCTRIKEFNGGGLGERRGPASGEPRGFPFAESPRGPAAGYQSPRAPHPQQEGAGAVPVPVSAYDGVLQNLREVGHRFQSPRGPAAGLEMQSTVSMPSRVGRGLDDRDLKSRKDLADWRQSPRVRHPWSR